MINMLWIDCVLEFNVPFSLKIFANGLIEVATAKYFHVFVLE